MKEENSTLSLGIGEEGGGTHVVKPPPQSQQKALTPLESVKMALAGDALKQITNYYAGNKDEALRFVTGAVEYIRRVPDLLKCDKTSLVMAFVQSAQFRFMPSSVGGEAYVIPYNGEAKFQLGYQGIVTLLYRTKQIAGITANIVFKNDIFEYQEGLDAKLLHKPTAFGDEKGEAIGVYTVAEMMNGAKTFKVMDKSAVMAIKDLSKAKNSEKSPWNGRDPELWMWKKTCLIQHSKLLPKTADLQQALAKDFEGEGLETPKLDPGGVAVPRAPHSVEADEDRQAA